MKTRTFPLFLTVLLAVVAAGCSKESRIANHIAKGDAFYASGDYEKARIEYLNVTQLDPQNAHAFGQIGKIFFENGVLLRSGGFLARAAQLGSEDPQVLARFGMLLAMSGDRTNALEQVDKALAASPRDEDAVMLLVDLATDDGFMDAARSRITRLKQANGDQPIYETAEAVLAFKTKDLAGAQQRLSAVLAKTPDYAPAWLVLSGVQAAGDNQVEARKSLARSAELSPPRSNRRMRYAELLLQEDPDAGKKELQAILKEAPDHVPSRLRLARLAFEAKDYDQTKSELNAVFSRDPQNLEGRQLEAQMYLANEDAEKAGKIMDDLVRVYPDSPQVRYQTALTDLARQRVDQALFQLEEAYKRAPGFSQVVLLRGRLLMAKGRTSDAIDSIEQLAANAPNFQPALLLLGEAYLRSNQPDKALVVYQDTEKRFPSDPRGAFLQGMLLNQQQKTNVARAAFERSAGIDPKFLPAVEQLCLMELRVGQAAAARQRLDRFLAAVPDSAEALNLRAQTYLADKDNAKAEADLEAAIRLNPKLDRSYYQLVQIYNDTGRKAEAQSKLEELLKTNPTDVRALMTLAIIYTEAGRHREAAGLYETLIKANPDYTPAYNNVAYLYSEYLDDLNRAYDMARKAQQQMPDDPRIGDTLGWILYRRGEYSQALVHLEQSAAKLPEIGEVQYHLGMAHYQMGHAAVAVSALQKAVTLAKENEDWKSAATRSLSSLTMDPKASPATAIADLQKLLADRPDDIVLLTKLAAAQEATGKSEEALANYRKASKLNPNAAEPVVGQARLVMASGNTAEAMTLVRRARELAGGSPGVAFDLGRIAYQARDFAYAQALLQDALKGAPENPQVQFAYAQTALALGRLDAAVAPLQKAATSTGPQQERATLQLKLLPFGMNQPVSGLGDALKQQLQSGGQQELLGRLVQARVLQAGGKSAEATAQLRALLTEYPQFAPAMKFLAVELGGNAANLVEAEKWARQAREVFTNDAELAKVLGRAALERKDYRYAANILASAAQALPDDGEIQFWLGRSQAELKQTEAARASVSKALTLPLNATDKQAAQALLNSLQPQ